MTGRKRNAVVGQSGGPTAVINNSLVGVIHQALQHDEIGHIYGMLRGIKGVLDEDLVDLDRESSETLEMLRVTPSSALGTVRYKVTEADYDRILEVLKAHDIGYFFYIGGNDSMDTANKVAQLAQERGLDVVGTGVPKTIDNDVGDSEFKVIDHTPGYGSVARYWALNLQNANEENAGSSPADPVLVMQAMGRKIGYIPAAARLGDPNREMPLLIFLRESGQTMEELSDQVNDMVKARGRALVVVSEGFDVGDIGERKDSFGHTMFSASGSSVEQIVVNYLNEVGLAARGAARGNVPGTDQRGNMIYASTVDLDEAYLVGRQAAYIAAKEGSGYMATILREPGPCYRVRYDKVPLGIVANSERTFPAEWIAPSRIDVTDEFLAYATPLIGSDWPSIPLVSGLQRYARLAPIFAETKLARYEPEAYDG